MTTHVSAQFSTPAGLQAIQLQPALTRDTGAQVFGDFVADLGGFTLDESAGGFNPNRVVNAMSDPTKASLILGDNVRARFGGLPFFLTRMAAIEDSKFAFDSAGAHVCVALTAVVIHWLGWRVTDTETKVFAVAANEVFVIPRFCSYRVFFGEMLIFGASRWLTTRQRLAPFGDLRAAGEPTRLERVVTKEGFESYEFPRDTDSSGYLGEALTLELLQPRSEGWVMSQVTADSPQLLYLVDGSAMLAAEGHEGRMSIGSGTALLLCAQQASYRIGSHGLLVRARVPTV